MQGIAGAIDRFGQAFGPVVGGSMLHLLGEASLMLWTGIALASISLVSCSAVQLPDMRTVALPSSSACVTCMRPIQLTSTLYITLPIIACAGLLSVYWRRLDGLDARALLLSILWVPASQCT